MIRFLKLPNIPSEILDNLNRNFSQYTKKVNLADGIYIWSDDFTNEISTWCKENICDSIHWGFQIISADLPIHKDIVTEIKLIYLIQTGGTQVSTNFYSDDQTTVTNSYIVPTNQWHLLDASRYHSVKGMEPGKVRFSLTGRIFPE